MGIELDKVCMVGLSIFCEIDNHPYIPFPIFKWFQIGLVHAIFTSNALKCILINNQILRDIKPTKVVSRQ